MATKTRVVNIRHSEYDVYIGRPSRWGNPFIIGRDGTREEVIEKFRDRVFRVITLNFNEVMALSGKRLGCYCKPLPCHGDVLVELIEHLERMKRGQT
jgi:hypothetical protein